MHFDPAALVTHIIGFLVALWIMRRYAWGPLLGLIEERRERIRRDLAAAEGARQEAQGMRQDLAEQLRGIEGRARQRLVEAVAEGQRVAGEIKENARAEAHGLMEKAREEIGRERDKARAALHEDVVELALAAAEKVVETKMDAPHDREVVRSFLGKMGHLQ